MHNHYVNAFIKKEKAIIIQFIWYSIVDIIVYIVQSDDIETPAVKLGDIVCTYAGQTSVWPVSTSLQHFKHSLAFSVCF